MSHLAAPCHSYFTSPVVTVEVGDDINEAYRKMSETDVSCLAVVEQGRIAGVLSRTDLLRIGTREAGKSPKAALVTLPHRRVEEVMTRDVVTVGQEDSIRKAAKHMVERRIHRVFVTNDQGEPVGVISTRDLMLAVRDARINLQVEEVMSCPAFTIRADEHVSEAVARLERAHISGLAVVDRDWPVGVFTQRDALLFQSVPRSTPVEEVMDPAVLVLSPSTLIHRAAAQAAAMKARRILVASGSEMVGVLTGLTFARVIAD
jgi:CBS domain-containing protein